MRRTNPFEPLEPFEPLSLALNNPLAGCGKIETGYLIF